MLSSLPDRELIARLEELRRAERDASLEILQHLIEIERRSLHLRLGYSSLFAYCTGHLRYSESSAARRVQAARCVKRFPRVGELLQSGDINLMTLGLIANLVTETTVDQWLERIRGKTQREVEAIAATVRPPVTLRDRARLVHVAVPTVAPLPLAPTPRATTDATQLPAADAHQCSPSMFAPSLASAELPSSPASDPTSSASSDPTSPLASDPTSLTSSGSGSPPAPDALVNSSSNSQTGGKESSTPIATQPKVYIQFLVDQSFMAKYRTAAGLLSNKLPKLTFEAVFTALIEDFISRQAPTERHERRERAAAREPAALAGMPHHEDPHHAADRTPIPVPTRDAVDRTPIPARTRDAVFARDRERCTFVGSDGKRCDATIRLHVDHIKPVARGGTNDIANLRLLCAWHNRLQAERILGRGVMGGFRNRADGTAENDERNVRASSSACSTSVQSSSSTSAQSPSSTSVRSPSPG